MARIRSIKPEFFHHEGLASCTPHARLLFVAMLQLADRSGRFRWIPMQVHAHAFPHERELDIPALAAELEGIGCIRTYTVGGKRFVDVENFTKHQKVPNSERKSVLPQVSQETLTTFVGHDVKQSRHWRDGGMEGDSVSSGLNGKDVDLGTSVSRIWNTYKKYHPRSRHAPPKSWREMVEDALGEYSADELCLVVRWAKESRDYSFQRSKKLDKLNNILAFTKLPGRIESALEWAGVATSLESYLEANAQAAIRYKDEFEQGGRAMDPGTLTHYMQEYGLPVPSPDIEAKVIKWLMKRKV